MSEFLTPFLQGLFYGFIGALGYSIVFNFLCGKLYKNKKPRKLINTKLVED
jgi:hypothetical protein